MTTWSHILIWCQSFLSCRFSLESKILIRLVLLNTSIPNVYACNNLNLYTNHFGSLGSNFWCREGLCYLSVLTLNLFELEIFWSHRMPPFVFLGSKEPTSILLWNYLAVNFYILECRSYDALWFMSGLSFFWLI